MANNRRALLMALGQSALLLLACSRAQDSKDFLSDAMRDGIAQVELSRLAVEKSTDPEVRKFAARMVEDHQRMNKEMAGLANISGTKAPRDMTADQRIFYEEMMKRSGRDFDTRFIQEDVKDHQKEIKKYNTQSEYGSDVNIRAFASRNLPVLREHLQTAQSIYTRLHP